MSVPGHLTLQPASCEVCGKRNDLLRCGSCQVAWYCGRAHQTSHWTGHKTACRDVKNARNDLAKEDDELRNLPERVFETSVGHFWGVFDTRDYMRARFHLANELISSFHNITAVQAALSHHLDMHRLNRSDNMGLRYITPGLFLRLGRNQEAYDFIKWWAVVDQDGHYDWGNTKLPYLDIKGADVFEAPSLWTHDYLDISHTAAMMLIKIRVLFDLRALQNAARALGGGAIPQELIDEIRGRLVHSDVVAARPDLLTGDVEHLASMIRTVKAHIKTLYKAVDGANAHFWSIMLDPEAYPETMPEYYSRGTVEEAQIKVNYSYVSWIETPGAMEIIEELEYGPWR